MNIIKFRDIECTNMGDELNGIFNKYFRGRFCFAIQMAECYMMRNIDDYETPGLTKHQYKWFEAHLQEVIYIPNPDITNDILADKNLLPHIPLDLFKQYIDYTQTDNIYDLDYYHFVNNEYVGNDPSLDEIKLFRRHVAEISLQYNESHDETIISMYNYYKDDMSDIVVKTLNLYKTSLNINYINAQPGYGCNNTSSLQTQTGPTSCCAPTSYNPMYKFNNQISNINCDTVREYKTMVKKFMINTYNNIEYWKNIDRNIPAIISVYINAIIKSGLSIFNNNNYIDINTNCKIASDKEKLYQQWVYDLTNISSAFKMIESQNYSDKNFISVQLDLFANYYEYMQWV